MATSMRARMGPPGDPLEGLNGRTKGFRGPGWLQMTQFWTQNGSKMGQNWSILGSQIMDLG